MTKVEVNGLTIVAGEYDSVPFAFDATCPHKGGPLDKGEIRGNRIKCPWHGYEFNVFTGEPVVIPYPPKYGEWRKSGDLRLYDAKILGDDLYIRLEDT